VTKNPAALAAVAVIVCIPVLFASFGARGEIGIVIGVVLMVAGLAWTLLGSRGTDDDGPDRST
jgi:hypothetical protein